MINLKVMDKIMIKLKVMAKTMDRQKVITKIMTMHNSSMTKITNHCIINGRVKITRKSNGS